MVKEEKQGIILSKKKLIILAVLAVLLIGGGVMLGMNWQNWFGETAAEPNLDDSAVDWKGDQPADSKDANGQKGIALPGYKSITLAAGQKKQNVNLYNPEINDCYFVMSLFLPDGKEIWKSKMVAPGKGLYQITLNQEISEGTYENSVLKYECYKQDEDLTKLNGGEVKITLEVK